MKITVSEIPEEGLDIELTETITSEAVKITSPLHALIRIEKMGTEALVNGIISGEVQQQCSRCLKVFDMNLKSRIDIIYHPVEEISKEEHMELKSDELDTGFYSGDILDTDDLLREQLLLNIPMKPLCSPECRGICPKCGADLNVSECGCETVGIDPRFEALKKLLKGKE